MDDDPEDEAERHHVCQFVANGGNRIDAAIAAAIDGLSRAHVQRLIDDGRVTANGLVVAKAGQRVRAGDRITVSVPPPEPIEVLPEPIPLVVLYEEPTLRKIFGAEYEEYCRNVRRWLPRMRAWIK